MVMKITILSPYCINAELIKLGFSDLKTQKSSNQMEIFLGIYTTNLPFDPRFQL